MALRGLSWGLEDSPSGCLTSGLPPRSCCRTGQVDGGSRGPWGPRCPSTLAATLTPWASDSGKLTVPWRTRGERRRWHRVQSCLCQGRWSCSFRGKWNRWPGGHEDRPRDLPARPRPRTPGGRARVGFSSFYRAESEAGGGRGIHPGSEDRVETRSCDLGSVAGAGWAGASVCPRPSLLCPWGVGRADKLLLRGAETKTRGGRVLGPSKGRPLLRGLRSSSHQHRGDLVCRHSLGNILGRLSRAKSVLLLGMEA